MAIDSRASGAIGGAAQGAAIGSKILPGWGTAIGALAGGLLGGLSGGGEDEAEALAAEQSRLVGMTLDENLRRASRTMEQTLGYTRAAIGANNVLFTGSSRRYYEGVESQFKQDMAWERHKARIEQRLIKKGGQVAASQIQYSGINSMVAGIGMAASTGLFNSGGESAPRYRTGPPLSAPLSLGK